jgi:hypothetical protein
MAIRRGVTNLEQTVEERNKELLKDAARYRDHWGTLRQMTEYYGGKYTDALEKAEKEEPYAYCLLGQMFKESIFHAKEKYEYSISGYRQLTKIYYELAANQGYAKGMYYLGNECFEDGELEQAEKWLVKAAEEGITASCTALGRLYRKLWETTKDTGYIEKAVYWTRKELEKNISAGAFAEMGDFCREIIKNCDIKDPEEKRKLLAEMKEYYLKALGLPSCPKSVLEELVAVCMGDYGHEKAIEEAFRYGKRAIEMRSDYAVLRLGEYCMEHSPEENQQVLYYLERAYDFGGKWGDKAKILLRKYLEENKLPEYMRAEAELLLENGKFERIGEWYRMGEIVKKSNQTALYFYTKSWGGSLVKRDMYTANCYSIAYFFLKDLEKEGISIPDKAWEEVEAERKEVRTENGFDTDVASLLADLNERYNIINMNEFQRSVKEPELSFDMPESELLNLRSEFYWRGMMDKLDQKYLKDYTDHLIAEIKASSSTGQVKGVYKELVALIDYAGYNSHPMMHIRCWEKIGDKVAAKISDAYLDAVLEEELSGMLEECFGEPETEYRRQCHRDYRKNWPNACAKMRSVYPDFLEPSEEKWQKEMELDNEEENEW